jgi:hypothetical protein
MSKYLSGVAALALLGAATFALPATAADRQAGVTAPHQSTELSSQRRHYRHGRVYARHWRGGPRYYAGPRYWGPGPVYGFYDDYPYYPYGYYRPGPLLSFGVGPFGFWF